MWLVIFGAGASFDSADMGHMMEFGAAFSAARLPLAKDLVSGRFDDIATEIPGSRSIVDLLRGEITQDAAASLETALANIAAESGGDAIRRQQLIAFRFYLHRVIADTATNWLRTTRGFTHYLTLMNALYRWHRRTGTPLLLATFNYDVLLDIAVQDAVTGWEFFGQLPNYIDRDDFRLFKLHGSTDWARVIPTQEIQGSETLRITRGLIAEDRFPTGEIEARQPSLLIDSDELIRLPAMAVPMAGKTAFECPTKHVDALRASMKDVTHVLIIGWRAAEPHAVELLAGKMADEGLRPGYALGLVTGSDDDAEEVRTNLGPVWDKARVRFIDAGGFSAFIRTLTVRLSDLLSD